MNKADILDWSLHLAMSGMPASLCSAIGARLAPRMGKAAHPEENTRILQLFARLRPDWAAQPGGTQAAADRLWANVGRTFAEFAVSHRMIRHDHLKLDGEEWMDAAMASGRPVIAIFAHLGNWEVSEMQIGFRFPGRVAVIVDPPASKARQDIANRVRRQVPADLLVTSRMVWRHARAKLESPGGCLMVAIDERAKNRVWGPSLGRPLTAEGSFGKVARLALATGAIVVPFHNERLDGARMITRFLPAMEFAGRSTDKEAVIEAVRHMDEAMSRPIVRLLDQWYSALAFTD